MPRPRRRVPLESGLSLKLPGLMRQGLVVPGARTRGTIRWSSGSSTVTIEANLLPTNANPWLDIHLPSLVQRIDLHAQPRHLGGHQWFFACPVTGRVCASLWRPESAELFASRQAWPGQVAYSSQFASWQDRAVAGAWRIRERLDPQGVCGGVGDITPPRPKGMRGVTYRRLLDMLAKYERTSEAYSKVLIDRCEA